MKLRNLLGVALLSAAGILAAVGSASAAPAAATTTLNVRSGPSTGYAVVDVLRRGEVVEVGSCRGGWCFVSKPGPDGWVSARYLEEVYTPRRSYSRYDRYDRYPNTHLWTPRDRRDWFYADPSTRFHWRFGLSFGN